MTDQSGTQNKAARCVPKDNDVPSRMDTTASVPVTKPASQRAAPVGIYIPKAKREQMEKDAAAAAAAKPSEPVKTKPLVKVQTQEQTNAHTGNNSTAIVKATTTSELPVPSKATNDVVPKIPQVRETVEASSSSTANSNAKPKEVVRGAVYVPKGRRELNEKKAVDVPILLAEPAVSSDGSSKSVQLPASQAANTGFSVGVSLPSQKARVVESTGRTSPPRSKTYSSWDDSSEDEATSSSNGNGNGKAPTPIVSVEDTIQQCTLVLSGVPIDMSELARSNITRAYVDKGATIKWTSTNECLLMFKTERAALQMVPGANASIFRVVRLQDMSGSLKEDLVAGISCLLYFYLAFRFDHFQTWFATLLTQHTIKQYTVPYLIVSSLLPSTYSYFSGAGELRDQQARARLYRGEPTDRCSTGHPTAEESHQQCEYCRKTSAQSGARRRLGRLDMQLL